MPKPEDMHRKATQDDVPPPSVQDEELIHTGATCPADGTLVTLSGPRGADALTGTCPACKRIVYGSSQKVHQPGTFDSPKPEDLEKPPEKDDE